jgi:hypothetical protein
MNDTKQTTKRSNMRAAIVPISIAAVFFLGFVVKQMLFK